MLGLCVSATPSESAIIKIANQSTNSANLSERQNRESYLRYARSRIKTWEKRTTRLQRVIVAKSKKTLPYEALLESVTLMQKDIRFLKKGVKKLSKTSSADQWQRIHNEMESRFRSIDSTYSHAIAD